MILHQHNGDIDYANFCHLVDRWKSLLIEKYKVYPGKKIVLEFVVPNAHYYSAVFAAFELGLVIISEWPPAFDEFDVHSHRMTMHGRIDYAIVHHGQLQPGHEYYNYWNLRRTMANVDHVVTDIDFDQHQPCKLDYPIFCNPDTEIMWAASGGTTGPAKQIRHSHQWVYTQSQRLTRHLNCNSHDHVLHIQNLLYGGGVYTWFIPTWMTAKEHTVMVTDNIKQIADAVYNLQITKLHIHTYPMTLEFIEIVEPLTHDLDIMSFSNLPNEFIDKIKNKNIHSVKSMFGDAMIGSAVFVKTINKNSTIPEPNYVGDIVDDFYDYKLEDGFLWISIPSLNQDWKTSQDRFEYKNGKYYFYGRGNQYQFQNQQLILGDLDLKVEELFKGSATIVVDEEYKKIYLAVWKENSEALREFKHYLNTTYNGLQISQTAKNLNINKFTVARKIDREKLKEYFRYYHQKPVAI